LIVNDNFVPFVKRDDAHKNVVETPADITPFCRIGTNIIKISSSSFLPYVVVVQAMKRLSVDHLITKIQPLEYSLALKKVQDSFRAEGEICALKAKLSMHDPILLSRITLPGRASTCTHIQCFDVRTYLLMNERIRTWLCPICNQRAEFKDLLIDSYFDNILSQLPEDDDISEVEIQPSGEWHIIQSKKEPSKESPNKGHQYNECQPSPPNYKMSASTNSTSVDTNDNPTFNQQTNNNNSKSTSTSDNISQLTAATKSLCALADTARRYANSLRQITKIFSNNDNNSNVCADDKRLSRYYQLSNHNKQPYFSNEEVGTSVENPIVLDSSDDSE
jgi:hypothetical protein